MKARVHVGLTKYPWNSERVGRWMWRCLTINECSAWHYDVDDCGYGDDFADVLARGFEHAALEHMPGERRD